MAGGGSVNPMDLYGSGSQQNAEHGSMGYDGAFNFGGGGTSFADDEILNSFDNEMSPNLNGDGQGFGLSYNNAGFPSEDNGFSSNAANIHSMTPEGNPMASPYMNDFSLDAFRALQQQNQGRNMGRSLDSQGTFGNPMAMRASSAARQAADRKGSTGLIKPPMTPSTPAMSALNLGATPESLTTGSQPIVNQHLGQHRHQKSLSQQWESHPGSLQSFGESPLSSPGHSGGHMGISDVLSAKHASLPAKVEATNFQAQEAKRRRRRESHNMVERRRRDNINERIQELSQLVPQHRLEDERVRKHLANNQQLSPGGMGISPPHATSLLAGGTGRRATGGITTGIPPDDKDKGPNKGDILNGSVSWTRDLMWSLYSTMMQNDELKQEIQRLNPSFDIDRTDEENRMRSELLAAVQKNGVEHFSYSRGNGSRLRVPGFTDLAGTTLDARQSGHGHSHSHSATLSPTESPSGAGANGSYGTPYWAINGNNHGKEMFNEEDEYDMDES